MTSTFACTRIAEWVVEITGEGTRGFVMGGGDGVLYVAFSEGVVGISIPRVPLMPNGIVLPEHACPRGTVTGADALLVPGLLRLAGRDVVLKPSTTYDTRITHPAPPGLLASRMGEIDALLDGATDPVMSDELHELASSVAASDARAVAETARLLVGRGEGLTPEGDDLLVGAVAACIALGKRGRVVQALVPDDVQSRTTALSATLLRHALVGRVVAPLLNLFSEGGHVGRAIHMLVHVGHSTGRAYLRGVRAVVQAVTAERPNGEIVHDGEEVT
jgi:hypothetical protein